MSKDMLWTTIDNVMESIPIEAGHPQEGVVAMMWQLQVFPKDVQSQGLRQVTYYIESFSLQ
jgi:hypothetical protein